MILEELIENLCVRRHNQSAFPVPPTNKCSNEKEERRVLVLRRPEMIGTLSKKHFVVSIAPDLFNYLYRQNYRRRRACNLIPCVDRNVEDSSITVTLYVSRVGIVTRGTPRRSH